MSGLTLAELADRLGATLQGDGNLTVTRVGTLDGAGPDAIAFFANSRFRASLATTKAGAVILSPAEAQATALPKLLHDNPYAAYARAAAILHPPVPVPPGIDPTARIGEGARVDAAASVGPYAVIGARAAVGAGAVVGAHAFVGDETFIGEGVRLHPHVTIYPRCVVGARTIIHSGAVIGADGFGMAEDKGRWVKIPQVGRVVIGADCEIGANTAIDRGAIDDTIIEDDVKLDNQIQIGHNCRIGRHTAIAGCTGIAGSTTVGRNVRIGGAAMIGGHITIADGAVIAGGVTVIGNVRSAGVYNGSFPVMSQRDWAHAAVEIRHLRKLVARVAALERALRAQPGKEGDAP